MKKMLLGFTLLAVAGSAMADGYYHGHGGGYYRTGGNWVAPAIIGGIVGYEMGRPRYVYEAPPVVVQQPVIIQQPQVIYQQAPAQQRQVCKTDYIIINNIQRTAQTCWFE
jgi:hypothetical protein